MANLSNTYGKITIEAEKNIIFEILHTLKILEKYAYPTYIESETLKSDNKYEAIFSANGRWTYESNIEDIKDLLDKNQPNDFKITFDYADEEACCEYLAEAVTAIEKKNGKIELTEVSFKRYDYNVKNIKKIAEIDFVYDYSESELERYIKDILDRNIKNKTPEIYDSLFKKCIDKAFEIKKEEDLNSSDIIFEVDDYIYPEIMKLINDYK